MQEQIEVDAASLAYLWTDEPKWTVQIVYDAATRIVVRLSGPGGPTTGEIKALRLLSPHLATLQPADAELEVGVATAYFLGEYGRVEGEMVAERGRELGLHIETTVIPLEHFLPVAPDGRAGPIIDDPALARYVMRKMVDAGCPVVPVEVD